MKTFNILTNTDKLIINRVAYMVTSYNNQTQHIQTNPKQTLESHTIIKKLLEKKKKKTKQNKFVGQDPNLKRLILQHSLGNET